jgi:hypothetical protein
MTYQVGDTSLDGVNIPYSGWAEQLSSATSACAPTVAQALPPYPQFCGILQGLDENHGNPIYNSFQLKLEKRYSKGVYILPSGVHMPPSDPALRWPGLLQTADSHGFLRPRFGQGYPLKSMHEIWLSMYESCAFGSLYRVLPRPIGDENPDRRSANPLGSLAGDVTGISGPLFRAVCQVPAS